MSVTGCASKLHRAKLATQRLSVHTCRTDLTQMDQAAVLTVDSFSSEHIFINRSLCSLLRSL